MKALVRCGGRDKKEKEETVNEENEEREEGRENKTHSFLLTSLTFPLDFAITLNPIPSLLPPTQAPSCASVNSQDS